MNLSDFNFDLPEELIAQTPVPNREESRLMVVDRESGLIEHHRFPAFLQYLEDCPLVVMNDTRVLPARLIGKYTDTGKAVELVLVQETNQATWQALVKGLAKIKQGQEFEFGTPEYPLKAIFHGIHEGLGIFRFETSGDLLTVLEKVGLPPLPPYIKRKERNPEQDRLDRERYQTVFATAPGAIAAPTAGLHFSTELLEKVRSRSKTVSLTLHVGVGTFQPIRTEVVEDHEMHKEYYRVPVDTLNAVREAKESGSKVLGVGTTTTRVLESLDMEGLPNRTASGWTNRFIYPGQSFKVVDRLLTNFHLPRSTLYLLVCAFGGKELMDRAYQEAIDQRYRFFSYGDAMLIM
ncbi:MAG: tRNA preQ1(34) S-adenosylmethionine ribosyltransferase-isomerase QueA [Candidatus Nitronauta litoralis]|uniref:S-adenosylmethionine:tRNA ribosyltransferase-isomerase n=1 Tax=Candidatus Nitronauta litoralis TaxID=2705533 RepID=A0A7T0BYH4_9BACT|nr:MAG: tRNA preQ1(34) S-adenosylmethionine ribosyltransferase-isomerase QueA [Candidatus Nitronauta litoralis]